MPGSYFSTSLDDLEFWRPREHWYVLFSNQGYNTTCSPFVLFCFPIESMYSLNVYCRAIYFDNKNVMLYRTALSMNSRGELSCNLDKDNYKSSRAFVSEIASFVFIAVQCLVVVVVWFYQTWNRKYLLALFMVSLSGYLQQKSYYKDR